MARISQQQFCKHSATRILGEEGERERCVGADDRKYHKVREVLMRGCGIGAMVMVHIMSLWLVPEGPAGWGGGPVFRTCLSYMRWEQHNIWHKQECYRTGQEEKEHLKPPTTNFGWCNNNKEPIRKYTVGFLRGFVGLTKFFWELSLVEELSYTILVGIGFVRGERSE